MPAPGLPPGGFRLRLSLSRPALFCPSAPTMPSGPAPDLDGLRKPCVHLDPRPALSSWAGVCALSLQVPGVCKTSRGPGRPAHFLPHGADIPQTRLGPATWGAVCGRPLAGPGALPPGTAGGRGHGTPGAPASSWLPGVGWPPSCPLPSSHRREPEILGPRLWGLAHLLGVEGGPVNGEALPRAPRGRGPWTRTTTSGPRGPSACLLSGPSQRSAQTPSQGSWRPGRWHPPRILEQPSCFPLGEGQGHMFQSLEGRTMRVSKGAAALSLWGQVGAQADVSDHPSRALPTSGLLPCVRVTRRRGVRGR